MKFILLHLPFLSKSNNEKNNNIHWVLTKVTDKNRLAPFYGQQCVAKTFNFYFYRTCFCFNSRMFFFIFLKTFTRLYDHMLITLNVNLLTAVQLQTNYYFTLSVLSLITQTYHSHIAFDVRLCSTLFHKKRPPFSYDCSFYKYWPIFIIFGTQYTELMCNITFIYLPTSLTYCCYTTLGNKSSA